MKNLIIFGGSFSTHFSTNNSVNLNESWPILLSEKLNLNLKNYALCGACNSEVINTFFINYKEIDQNDIVLIDIGYFERIYDQFNNTTINFDDDLHHIDEIDINFYKRKILNCDKYIFNDLLKYDFICEYLTQRKIQFYIWCIDGNLNSVKDYRSYNQLNNIYQKYINNFILFNNKFSMMDELVQKNPDFWVKDSDKHFNKNGHTYFYNLLLNKLK